MRHNIFFWKMIGASINQIFLIWNRVMPLPNMSSFMINFKLFHFI